MAGDKLIIALCCVRAIRTHNGQADGSGGVRGGWSRGLEGLRRGVGGGGGGGRELGEGWW